MLTGQTVYLTGRVVQAGSIHRVPPAQFRRLMAEDPELSDLVLKALLARRELLRRGAAARSVEIVGSGLSAGALALRTWAARQALPHLWFDSESPDGRALMQAAALDTADLPAVLVLDDVLRRATVGELADHLGPPVRAQRRRAHRAGGRPGDEVRRAAVQPVPGGGAGDRRRPTVVVRGPDLAAGMSSYLAERLLADPRITVRTSAEVSALHGETSLRRITLTDRSTGATNDKDCHGLFCFIGAVPATGWLTGVALDDSGFVRTDVQLAAGDLGPTWAALGRGPLPFETSMPAVFAAGDVRLGSMKRVAAAVGEGSSAVRSVHAAIGLTV